MPTVSRYYKVERIVHVYIPALTVLNYSLITFPSYSFVSESLVYI